jgi:hypothetical protein
LVYLEQKVKNENAMQPMSPKVSRHSRPQIANAHNHIASMVICDRPTPEATSTPKLETKAENKSGIMRLS